MKRFSVGLACVLVLSGCSADDQTKDKEDVEVAAVDSAESTSDSASVDPAPAATEETVDAAPAPAESEQADTGPDAGQATDEEYDEPEQRDEPVEEQAEDPPVEQEAAPAPVLPVINDIEFFCRNRLLTVNVHAKIPGTKGSEGRYYFGIDSITAYRKNEENAWLDHELKWDGAYDPERDKWISAERTIAGDQTKDDIRIVIEGQDANGNDVMLEMTVDHGTGC